LLLLILGTILLVGLATLLAALIPASRAAKIELLGFPAATPG
jgi:ABC-type lipoprotein release transport system permease subunit